MPVPSMSGASPLLTASLLLSSTASSLILLNIFIFKDLAKALSKAMFLDCK